MHSAFKLSSILPLSAKFINTVLRIADRLGNEKPSVTLDIYADVAPEAKRDSLEKMKACLDLDMDGAFGELAYVTPVF